MNWVSQEFEVSPEEWAVKNQADDILEGAATRHVTKALKIERVAHLLNQEGWTKVDGLDTWRSDSGAGWRIVWEYSFLELEFIGRIK